MISIILNNVQLISIVFSFILIIIAIRVFSISKKTYKLQAKRPHCEKIGEDFQSWIDKFSSSIIDPKSGLLKYDELEDIPLFIKKHLETGYRKIDKSLIELSIDINEFNKELINYVKGKSSIFKNELGIPKFNPKNSLNEWASYEYMIISAISDFILNRNKFYGYNLCCVPFDNIQESTKLTEIRYESNYTVVKSSSENCHKAILIINKFIKTSKDKIESIYTEYENIIKRYNILKENIKVEIIDKAYYGGIIKGKCSACC